MTGRPEVRSSHPDRSPSGMFTRGGWEQDIEAGHTVMPRRRLSAADCDRLFLAWVEAEAMGLAAQLGRLDRSGVEPDVRRDLHGLLHALGEDAEWARKRIEAVAHGGSGGREAA